MARLRAVLRLRLLVHEVLWQQRQTLLLLGQPRVLHLEVVPATTRAMLLQPELDGIGRVTLQPQGGS